MTGLIPLETNGIGFSDIATITIWRTVDVVELCMALLVPTPIALSCVWATFAAASPASFYLLGIGLVFGLLAAFMIYRAVGVQRHYARLTGPHRTLTVRFDRPLRRRRRFHDELMRRVGLTPSEVP